MTKSSNGVTALATIALLALLPACTSATEPADSEEELGEARSELFGLLPLRCDRVAFPVALVEGQPASYNVVGSLCGRGSIKHRTIQVLLHGATYGRVYWDFPYQPERYSYVRSATSAGFATLAIDRIGIGESDHPGPFEVTIKSNAYVVHQVITALRAGTLNTASFGNVKGERVMLVGHSMGTVVSIREAATYHDVDGVIATGFLHTQGPGLAALTLNLVPASTDPVFAGRNIPAGYVTTKPGTRGESYFYYAPTSDPAVIAVDEATKETATPGEFSDFFASGALSPQIDVPVLTMIGNLDETFCAPPSCSDAVIDGEPAFYSGSPDYEIVRIPLSSHDLNLHKHAQLTYAIATAWSALHVGIDARFRP